jgi:hypothetical protein
MAHAFTTTKNQHLVTPFVRIILGFDALIWLCGWALQRKLVVTAMTLAAMAEPAHAIVPSARGACTAN